MIISPGCWCRCSCKSSRSRSRSCCWRKAFWVLVVGCSQALDCNWNAQKLMSKRKRWCRKLFISGAEGDPMNQVRATTRELPHNGQVGPGSQGPPRPNDSRKNRRGWNLHDLERKSRLRIIAYLGKRGSSSDVAILLTSCICTHWTLLVVQCV